MAMQVASSSRPGRRFRGGGPLADINVIPLVDVTLVLLIMFLLTAHVMEFGLEIQVPRVDVNRATAEQLPVVSITKEGHLFVNENPSRLVDLVEALKKRFPKATGVYLKADRDTVFNPIAQVISTLGKAGYQVKVVTQPADSR